MRDLQPGSDGTRPRTSFLNGTFGLSILSITIFFLTYVISFLTREWSRGMRLDALESTHPIEADVKRPSDIAQLFDAISYAKGAIAIGMLCSYLGEENFFHGISVYLKRYMYGNASTKVK